MMDTTRYQLAPYKFNGRDFDGFDCYGLLKLFHREEFGIDLLDYKHGLKGGCDPGITMWLIENAHREFVEVQLEDARFGDCLLLRNRSRLANHCGIILGGKFLHTMKGVGCVTSKISTWRPHIAGVYRHRELL